MPSSAMSDNRLIAHIHDLVRSTPPETIAEIVQSMQAWQPAPTGLEKAQLLAKIHSPQARAGLVRLLDCWREHYPSLTTETVTYAFLSAMEMLKGSVYPSLELIWTGPQAFSSNYRRTDQALLELVNGAKEQLLVVSFAVYKAQPILEAIENALRRNVKVAICLEDSNESQGKLSVSGMDAFKKPIFRFASFYTWPLENRYHDLDGRFGLLHAKLAAADRRTVFISSANLTGHAMDLNMEIGVLIKDKKAGEQVANLFDDMIVNGVFKKIALDS